LQKTVDQQLYLYSDMKEQSSIIAQVMVTSLTSLPISDEVGMSFGLCQIRLLFWIDRHITTTTTTTSV